MSRGVPNTNEAIKDLKIILAFKWFAVVIVKDAPSTVVLDDMLKIRERVWASA